MTDKKTEHTPGPWRADTNEGCKDIRAGKFGDYKQAQYKIGICTTHGLDEEEDRANALLIAAAPETDAKRNQLREAITVLIESECCGGVPNDMIGFLTKDWECFLAAIAKAGE